MDLLESSHKRYVQLLLHLGFVHLSLLIDCMLTDDWYPLAEWAIARLQAEAAYQLREMESVATKADNDSGTAGEGSSSANVTDAPSHDSASPIRPVGRYHCTSCHRHGNLSVTTQAVAFKQHLTKDRSWQLDYDRIKSMQKVRLHPHPFACVILSGITHLFSPSLESKFHPP